MSVRLSLLLPNPPGDENQNEEATLANDGSQPVSMVGWTLRDRAGRNWLLDSLGTVAPGEEKTSRRGSAASWSNTLSGAELPSIGRARHRRPLTPPSQYAMASGQPRQ